MFNMVNDDRELDNLRVVDISLTVIVLAMVSMHMLNERFICLVK